ncbi:crotonase/enoyl-CoA hydratase family protein [Nocardioides dubius]|uniref:Crotonase/enoyl-CoA hydratase family protein n=1 Tax=Nocardioides dubius TaxID=317019 RepID=A0ABP4E7S9_9ACTN
MTLLVSNTVTDGIAHVRLTRPEKLNALTLDTLDQLVETARTLSRDRALRAVVISGEGEAFCAGLDFATVLKSPRRVAGALIPRPWRGTNTFQEACWAWRRVPVPVIAAVHGHCYGGGLQLALAADFRFSAADAQWSVMEAKWGLIPDMSGVQALSELVGLDTAKRLTMTAEVFDGDRARELGLVTEVAEDPLAAATAFAAQLAQRSPDQLAAAKRLFGDTWHASARRTFARERWEQYFLLASANTKAAREAAFKRVPATFTARRR